jgi:hypothetical protein
MSAAYSACTETGRDLLYVSCIGLVQTHVALPSSDSARGGEESRRANLHTEVTCVASNFAVALSILLPTLSHLTFKTFIINHKARYMDVDEDTFHLNLKAGKARKLVSRPEF